LGIAITPKASRALERRPNPPGQHGGTKDRRKGSDYKRRLIEKQRLRAQYNIEEKQMRDYVKKAMRRPENPVDALVQLLETRLDAIVYRAGLARTIYQARQFMSHGHIRVNGKKVNVPGQRLKPEEVVAEMPARATAPYLERSREQMSARLNYVPGLAEVPLLCEMSMVIEFYSR
jgi:small subunit ribosomal protein S4